jgi:quercetin dioxygenase-like cupin family protein
VDVTRWEQFGLDDELPFKAMWYSVPPNSSSPPDRHPEIELSLVINGTASVEVGGDIVRVSSGDAFVVMTDEEHTVHNDSQDGALLIYSAYWMPVDVD